MSEDISKSLFAHFKNKLMNLGLSNKIKKDMKMECREIKDLTIDDLKKHLGKKLPEECIGFIKEPLDECDLLIIILCIIYNQNKDEIVDEAKKDDIKKLFEIKNNMDDEDKDKQKKEKIINDIIKIVISFFKLSDFLSTLLDILFNLFGVVDVATLEKIFVFIITPFTKNDESTKAIKNIIDNLFQKLKENINKTKKDFIEEMEEAIEEIIGEIGEIGEIIKEMKDLEEMKKEIKDLEKVKKDLELIKNKNNDYNP